MQKVKYFFKIMYYVLTSCQTLIFDMKTNTILILIDREINSKEG